MLAAILFVSYFDSVAQYALQSASSSIPGRLKVKKFSPTLNGVDLEDIRWDLDENEPFFVADRVQVRIDHAALLRRDWLVLVRQAKIENPGLRVNVDANGNVNLTKLVESDGEPSTLDIKQLRTVLEWDNGWILYSDRRGAGFLYELTAWKGTTVFPDGRLMLVKTESSRKEDASRFHFEGEVALESPRLSMTASLGRVALLPFGGFPGLGPGPNLLGGELDGRFVVQGRAESWGEIFGSVFTVGKVELKEGLLASPYLPVDFQGLNGEVRLLGREVSTSGFQGTAAEIPFSVTGKAELGPQGELQVTVETERFPLQALKPYLENPPDITGEAQVELAVEGRIDAPEISGRAEAFALTFQEQTVPKASARFLLVKELVHLYEVVAQTAAGEVTGEGWVFLGEKPRLLFALQGVGAQPSAMVPDLAESADFRVRVLGAIDDPVLFGQGELRGLGSWAQGASSAAGQFYLKGKDLMLIDGLAFKGESRVEVPVAAVDIENRRLDGFVATDGFSLADVPGLQGVSGYVSGEAVVSADLSGDTPRLSAEGRLKDGSFASSGYSASNASGAFAFDGSQLLVPDAYANVEGGRVNLAGVLDLRDNAVAFSARGTGLSLAALGLPGRSANLVGSLTGQLGGELGIYGYADSPSLGRAALSGFQRSNGTLGGVAWVDGEIPGQEDSQVKATVVAGGTLERLSLEYTGEAQAPLLSQVGPLDLFGSAELAGRVLTVHPTLVSARSDTEQAEPLRYLSYTGAAYPFFGPLLSGPLEKVVLEEHPTPAQRSLSVVGQANLASQQLDFRFHMRAAHLEELADQPLGGDPDAASLNETLPFDILSGFGSLRGSLKGSFVSPELQADYNLPWVLLANGYENRQAIASRGRVRLKDRTLEIETAGLSETPFDRRLMTNGENLYTVASQTNGLLAARGKVTGDQTFDLRLATAGVNASLLTLFAPQSYLRYLPYGRIATENLHVWGTAASPSLAGGVQLLGGGIFLAGDSFPFQAASLNFSSQGGETRIEDLVLQAPGLSVTGHGKRSATGQLSGEILAQDMDLQELHRFGPPLTGLSGRADAIVALAGQFPRRPALTVALRGRELFWNPAALGGLTARLPIEEFALGHFTEDGTSFESGLSVIADDEGLLLELPPQGFRFRSDGGGLALEAQGAIRLPGGVPDVRMFKTFSDANRYFTSPNGPDFGRAGVPFSARVDNWSFAEIARYLGRADLTPHRASGSASLALEGQWWRDHKRENQGPLPHYSLGLDSLIFEGDREGQVSGFDLQEPARLVYSREGEAGFLSLENLSLGFFSHPAPGSALAGINPALPPEELFVRRGSLEAESKLAITQLPESSPVSYFHLGAVDIPLGNLAFLLPDAFTLDGLVDSIEVNMVGLLPTPKLTATALVRELAVGPLRDMTLQGQLTGTDLGDGGYVIAMGDQQSPTVTINFGSLNTADHKMQAEGSANLLWQRLGPLDPSRLNFFAKGLSVSPESPLDLSAQFMDKNLRVLSDLVPGQEQTRGDFSASLSVDGTLGHPEFEGEAVLKDGQFRSQRYGNFDNLQIDATVERIAREEAEPSTVLESISSGLVTRFSLSQMEGTLGQKPFFASGRAEFAGILPTYLNMYFVGEALPIQLPDLFTGTTDVDMELRGRMATVEGQQRLTPVVLGNLSIPNGDFHVPLGAVEGEGVALPIDYDISINLGQEFYAHLYDSRVRAVGELRVLSDKGEPKLYGQVDLSRGEVRIPFYDASFRIRQGVAHFEGPMIPRLEAVQAVADLGGYRIVAHVEGTYPDRLNVNLFSDPPLPQAELSRLVVLGGLPAQFSGVNDPNQSGSSLGVLAGGGVSFLSGMLTNRVTEQIGRIFLLSEVSFDYVPPASYVIKLAKALDPHDTFLLTLTRVIRDNGLNENLYGIEWRLTQTFLTRIALDQYNRMRFWIQSINRF